MFKRFVLQFLLRPLWLTDTQTDPWLKSHMSRRASIWPVSLTMVNLLQPSSGSGESVCLSVPHEQESLNLTCVSNNGKPAATFKWFRWVCLSVCLYHISRRASIWPVSLTMVNLLQPSSGSGESVCLSVCLSVCTTWAGEPQSDLCL